MQSDSFWFKVKLTAFNKHVAIATSVECDHAHMLSRDTASVSQGSAELRTISVKHEAMASAYTILSQGTACSLGPKEPDQQLGLAFSSMQHLQACKLEADSNRRVYLPGQLLFTVGVVACCSVGLQHF
jgi:hypothetical protein